MRAAQWPVWRLFRQITGRHEPRVLFASESLTQALRQLELYGRDGLPVLADDGQHVQGWITSHNVLQAIARQISAARATANQAPRTRRQDPSGPQDDPREAPDPLDSYQLLEVTIPGGSPAAGQALGGVCWPPGCVPVTVLHARTLSDPDPDLILAPGDHINLLAPQPRNLEPSRPRGEPGSQPGEHPPDTRPPGQALRPEDVDPGAQARNNT